MDMPMDDKELAVRVINGWIHEHRMLLKDGSPHGLHPRAKETLIDVVAGALAQTRGSLPPARVAPSPVPGATSKREPSKPRSLKKAKASDEAEA